VVDACGRTLAEAPAISFVRRGKARLELQRLWLKRFIRFYTSSRGRRKRRFLRENYPQLKPYKLDYAQLHYNEQQFDLLMRQFPLLSTSDLDARIRGFADALNMFGGFKSAIVANNLFTILR